MSLDRIISLLREYVLNIFILLGWTDDWSSPMEITWYRISNSASCKPIAQFSRVYDKMISGWYAHPLSNYLRTLNPMMTSSNGNIFHVTGPLPVTGGFPSKRPTTRNFDVFFDARLGKRLSKHSTCRCFRAPLRSLWRYCNVMFRSGSYTVTTGQ